MGYVPPPPPPDPNKIPPDTDIGYYDGGIPWVDSAFEAIFAAMNAFGRHMFPFLNRPRPTPIRDYSSSPSLIGTWKEDYDAPEVAISFVGGTSGPMNVQFADGIQCVPEYGIAMHKNGPVFTTDIFSDHEKSCHQSFITGLERGLEIIEFKLTEPADNLAEEVTI